MSLNEVKILDAEVSSLIHSTQSIRDLATAVQELIYNSIDASAESIKIFLNLQKFSFSVADDGCGFESHLLQKEIGLSNVACGTCGVYEKYGTRGNTLLSLSRLGNLDIESRSKNNWNTFKKTLKHGKVIYNGRAGTNRRVTGSTVSVQNLFSCYPVRQKMYSSRAHFSKMVHVITEFCFHISLIWPNISFELFDTNKDSVILRLKRDTSILSRLKSVIQTNLEVDLKEVSYRDSKYAISGYVSFQVLDSINNQDYQYFYINKRWFKKFRLLHDKVNLYFGQYYNQSVSPMFLLLLQCESDEFDCSCETDKSLIQFRNISNCLTFLEKFIKESGDFRKESTVCESHCEDKFIDKDVEYCVQVNQENQVTNDCRLPVNEVHLHNVKDFDYSYSNSKQDVHVDNSVCDVHQYICTPTRAASRESNLIAIDYPPNNSDFPNQRMLNDFAYEDKFTNENVHRLSANDHLFDLEPGNVSKQFNDNVNYLSEKRLYQNFVPNCSPNYYPVLTKFNNDNKSKDELIEELIFGERNYTSSINMPFKSQEPSSTSYVNDTLCNRIDSCHELEYFNEGIPLRRNSFAENNLMKSDAEQQFLLPYNSPEIYMSGFEEYSRESQFDKYESCAINCKDIHNEILCTMQSCIGGDGSEAYVCRQLCLNSEKLKNRLSCANSGYYLSIYNDEEESLIKSIQNTNLIKEMEYENEIKSATINMCEVNYALDQEALSSQNLKSKDLQLENFNRIALETANSTQFPSFSETFDGIFFKESNRTVCKNTFVPSKKKQKKPAIKKGWISSYKLNVDRELVDCRLPISVARTTEPNSSVPVESLEGKKTRKRNKKRKKSSKYFAGCSNNKKKSAKKNRNTTPEGPKNRKDSIVLNAAMKCPFIDFNHRRYSSSRLSKLKSIFLRPIKYKLPKTIFTSLTVIQQVEKKFIIAAASDIIFCIDQHAADERIKLEALEDRIFGAFGKKNFPVVEYKFPHKISLSSAERYAIEVNEKVLKAWGFNFSWICSKDAANLDKLHSLYQQTVLDDGMRSVILLTAPIIDGRAATPADFIEYIQHISKKKNVCSDILPPPVFTRILHSRACRSAIMFGDYLSYNECTKLIENLSKCKLPFQCAHGRPSIVPMINFSSVSLEEACRK